MKRYTAHFKSKDGHQYVSLLADSKEEAEKEAKLHQSRRHLRFPLTFDRIQAAHDAGDLTSDQFKAEILRRKRDQARYDDDALKLVSVKEEN